jgi:hypothetical protein
LLVGFPILCKQFHLSTALTLGFEAAAPLIRHGAMLSTTANPTDGLRFDGDAKLRRTISSSRGLNRGQTAAEWSW